MAVGCCYLWWDTSNNQAVRICCTTSHFAWFSEDIEQKSSQIELTTSNNVRRTYSCHQLIDSVPSDALQAFSIEYQPRRPHNKPTLQRIALTRSTRSKSPADATNRNLPSTSSPTKHIPNFTCQKSTNSPTTPTNRTPAQPSRLDPSPQTSPVIMSTHVNKLQQPQHLRQCTSPPPPERIDRVMKNCLYAGKSTGNGMAPALLQQTC